jgi:uncharacterized protein (TIGR02271 family)
MIAENEVRNLIGRDVIGSEGQKIGTAGQVYFDDVTGQPDWVTVNTGLFGMNESFVPLQSAQFSEDRLTVPFDKDTVKDAPNVDPSDGHLSPEDEAELYRYYGMGSQYESGTPLPRQTDTSGFGTGESGGGRFTDEDVVSDRDRTSDRTTDTAAGADDAMTRSEERLRVGTESRQTGRARLRKYVTTEEQTVTVPVTREEVRLEREPITDENRGEALSGPDITEDDYEVTLHEEQPVVATEAVPVERVRLAKEQVTDQEEVTGQVRKEHIEAEGTSDELDER